MCECLLLLLDKKRREREKKKYDNDQYKKKVVKCDLWCTKKKWSQIRWERIMDDFVFNFNEKLKKWENKLAE